MEPQLTQGTRGPVRVSADGQALEPGPAKLLFRVAIVPAGWNRHQYAVAPDNQRFLVNARADEAATASITVRRALDGGVEGVRLSFVARRRGSIAIARVRAR
jgi:hypothetical protein